MNAKDVPGSDSVLGVTFVGARDQIAKQLLNRKDIDPSQIFFVSGYIAKTVSFILK